MKEQINRCHTTVAILIFAASLPLILTLGAQKVSASVLCVNTAGSGGCFTTIRAAIGAAASGSTIRIASGQYLESALTIGDNSGKQPVSLTLIGAGPSTTVIDANGEGTVITVNPNSSLTLVSLSVENGGNAGIAVLNGALMVSNSQISGNGGGGIGSSGSKLQIQNSSIINNTGGSGLSIAGSKKIGALILDSTISGNLAPENIVGGAGVFVGSATTATIVNCTISGNQISSYGGGVTEGGGIYNLGTLDLNNDTIANNVAARGGGIQNLWQLTISNTIIADNTSTYCGSPDCAVPLVSNGYNLAGSSGCFNSGTGDIVADPLLAPLGDNPPGLNETQELLPGSPAIGAGNPAIGPSSGGPGCASTDERGVKRVAGQCDIGAYQS